jgi:hypothetical protein
LGGLENRSGGGFFEPCPEVLEKAVVMPTSINV